MRHVGLAAIMVLVALPQSSNTTLLRPLEPSRMTMIVPATNSPIGSIEFTVIASSDGTHVQRILVRVGGRKVGVPSLLFEDLLQPELTGLSVGEILRPFAGKGDPRQFLFQFMASIPETSKESEPTKKMRRVLVSLIYEDGRIERRSLSPQEVTTEASNGT